MPGDRLEVPDSSDNDFKKLLHDDHIEPKLGKQHIFA